MAPSKFKLFLLLAFCLQIALCVGAVDGGEEQLQQNDAQNQRRGTTTAEEDDEDTSQQRKKLAPCDVFDPFKVMPSETEHFQIGGAFPLHEQNCLKLMPSSVQDVVAIQWALAHWNEQMPPGGREKNLAQSFKRPKLGLFAGESCSMPKEALSQTLRFLDSVGYHEPSGCANTEEEAKRIAQLPKLIGVLMPKDRASAESVAQMLRPASLPIAAFSAASAQALTDANVRRFITTAPLFSDYAKTLVELLKMLGSDLISIVDYGDDYAYTPLLKEHLRGEGISTAEVVSLDHPMLPSILSASDSKIVVSLVPHRTLRNARLGELKALVELQKLWIGIDTEIDGGTDETEDGETNAFDFLADDSESRQNAKLQFVTVRRRVRPLTEFSTYFLRVLQSNHAHYTLLRAYAEQVFDCEATVVKGRNCSSDGLLSAERMAKVHRQSSTAEAAILLTHALARAAQWVESKKELAQKCAGEASFVECNDAIHAALLNISANDRLISSGAIRLPPGFAKQLGEMRFFETPEGVIQLIGVGIEAIVIEREGKDRTNLYRLLEYRTADAQLQKNVEKFVVPQKLRQFRSRCRPFRPFCGDRCELATRRPSDNTFLSIPQQYPFFIAAMFDLKGPNCGINGGTKGGMGQEIALPLAFVHAVSTFRARHSPQSLLFNSDSANAMDIGALLVDTCSNGRELLEFLVDSERNCYKFSQAERNWTVPAGATIGYIVGAEHDASKDGIIQAMFGKAEASPVIGVGTDQPSQNSQKGPLFTEGPNHRSTALALAQFLRRMHWQYVNVVLDRSSHSSVALFKQFDRIASFAGICFADLAIVGQQTAQNNGHEDTEEEEEEAHLKRKKAKRGSSASKTNAATEEEQRRRFAGVGPPSANVTLVFASAEQAAEYMGTRVQSDGTVTGIPTVHVMLGDAHNFYLHDPTNLAQFAGTLSFQAKDFATTEFRNWLQTLTPLSLPEPWFWRYVEETWHCSLFRNTFSHFNGRMCTGEERLDVKRMGQLGKAGYLAKGVDRLLVAIDKAHKKLCIREKLCDEFIENGRKLTREYLRKSGKEQSAEMFEVFEFMPIDHHGNFDYSLMANLSLPRASTDSSASSFSQNNIPSISTSIAIHFFADYHTFAYGVPITRDSPSATVISRCKSPHCKCPLMMSDDLRFDADVSAWLGHSSVFRREPTGPMTEMNDDYEFLLRENSADEPEIRELSADAVDREVAWAIRAILLSLSALLSAIAVGTLLCILFKIWRRTIRGSQSLGILLLLGIITMHLSAFLFTIESANEPFLCLLRIALPSMAHAICFGVIIVKAIQLRNAELLSSSVSDFGQQISYWNYWLLLFFIVTVQSVICFRWLLPDLFSPFSLSPPMAMAPSFFALRCSQSSALFLLAQIYTFFLLFLALFLSVQNRSIKRNYKEAKWLFITSLICSLILIAWAVFHTLVSVQHMEYLTVLELHLTGSILLAFVFGPKLYVLLFYEPVVVQYDSDGCVHGGKALDLFEAADWMSGSMRDHRHSPTMSTESSSANEVRNISSSLNNHNSSSRLNSGNSSMRGAQRRANDEEEEKVTSAFHTVMRKKISTGSNTAHKLHRTVSESARNSARDSFCGATTTAQTEERPKKCIK